MGYLLSLGLLVTLVTYAIAYCPVGWKKWNNNCYFLERNTRYYIVAKDICESMTSELTSIRSRAENNFIINQIRRTKIHWWIGLVRDKNGRFTWTDGSAADTNRKIIKWKPKEPSTKPYGAVETNGFYMSNPRVAKGFICKRNVSVPVPCPNGWQHLNNMCYTAITRGKARKWWEAQRECQRRGANLIKVSTINKSRFTMDKAYNSKKHVWIGLRYWDIGKTKQWLWHDGEQLDPKTAFWKGKPKPDPKQNNTCVFVPNNAGGDGSKVWQTTPCDSGKYFVCERPEGTCEPGWRIHTSNCYKPFVLETDKNSWDGAKRFCSDRGAILMYISSGQEQTFLQTILFDLRVSGINDVWLGVSSEGPGKPWRWVDGKNNRYRAWLPGEPRRLDKRGCGVIHTVSARGLWATTTDCYTPKAFFCKIPVGRPVVEPTTVKPVFYCRRGWTRRGTRCFKIFGIKNRMSWVQARQNCREQRSDLVKIDSGDINTFITKTFKRSVWIGLHKRSAINKFVWLDEDQPPSFSFWAPKEPSKNVLRNCGRITRKSGSVGKWVAQNCKNKAPYICETAADQKDVTITTTPMPTPSWDARCGFMWTLDPLSSRCYFFSPEFIPWRDAKSTCVNRKGTLLSINSPHEQAFITARLKNVEQLQYWIGMNDLGRKLFWVWADKAPVSYVNWDKDNPNNKMGKDCGVYVTTRASWQTRKCSSRYGYICTKPALPPSPATSQTPTTPVKTTPTTTMDGKVWGCLGDFKQFGQKCYWFAKNVNADWETGRSTCIANGGNLVSILSQLEQKFVASQAKAIYKGNVDKVNNLLMIGLNCKMHSNYYLWSDAQRVTYTNWGPNEPNNWGNRDQDCVVLNIQTGRWQDASCGDTGRGFICKKNLELKPKPVTTPNIPGCPKGTNFAYDDGCYIAVNQVYNWNDAQNYCQKKLKGNLVDILNRFEQAYLTTKLVDVFGDWWIGFTNKGDNNGKWSWSSKARDKYTNWNKDFTGNEREKCAAVNAEESLGLWLAKDCKGKLPFACKVLKYGSTRAPVTTPVRPIPCPNGWKEYKDYCYQANAPAKKEDQKSWSAALDHCKSMGADLVSVHSKEEGDFLSRMAPSFRGGYWLGLHTRDGDEDRLAILYTTITNYGLVPNAFQAYNVSIVPGVTLCEDSSLTTKAFAIFRWTDGSAFDFTYWVNGEPDNHNQMEDCTEKQDRYPYKWGMYMCSLRKNWICKLKKGDPFVTPTTPKPTLRPDKHCGIDRDWYYLDGHCYYVGTKAVTWFTARDECLKNGGDLSSIHNKATNAFLVQMITSTGGTINDFWIGLNFLDRRQYRWTDGSNTNFIAWAPGEPNNWNYGQLCVNLAKWNGFWFDDNCGDKIGYICRKFNGTITPKTHPVTTPVQGFCPSGFYGMGNKCFGAFGIEMKNRVNFKEAAVNCHAKGTEYFLASIHSPQDQMIINSLLGDAATEMWIGLNTENQAKLQWIDNSELDFTNWVQGQPVFGRWCARTMTGKKHGQWGLVNCNDKKGYICQYSKRSEERIATSPTLPPNKCKPGYYPYKQHCYKLLSTPQNWETQEETCVRDGGHLASIQDLGEESVITLLLKGVSGPVWFGLISLEGTGQYGWVDGWPLRYTNWANGNPKDPFRLPCGTMQGACKTCNGRRWNATECDPQYAGICRTTTAEPPPTPPYVPGKCSDTTWKEFGKHCFKAMKDRTNFALSSHRCWTEAASLVSIHTMDENIMIAAHLQDSDFEHHSWIGLSRPKSDLPWVWYDGTEVQYTNWETPDEAKGREGYDCAYMDYTTGSWKSSQCGESFGRICKNDKVPFTNPPGPPTTRQPTGNPRPTGKTTGSSISPRSTLMPSIKTPRSTSFPSGRTTQWPFSTVRSPGRLSPGQSVGIAFGVILAVLLGVVVLVVVLRRKNRLPYADFSDSNRGTETGRGFNNILFTASPQTSPGPLSMQGVDVAGAQQGETSS